MYVFYYDLVSIAFIIEKKYLQDTPDFLRHLEELKKKDLPENSFPISLNSIFCLKMVITLTKKYFA